MRACARRGDLLDDAAQDRRPHPDVALELARLALGGAALGRSVEGALAAARAVEREPACTLLELREALGRARQLVHHRQHLAPAQAEPEQARDQTLLDAREARGAPGPRLAAELAPATAERLARRDQRAHASELGEEPAALAHVVFALLALLVGLVAHQIA